MKDCKLTDIEKTASPFWLILKIFSSLVLLEREKKSVSLILKCHKTEFVVNSATLAE